MSTPAEIWRQAADKFTAVLAEVAEDQWERASTCDEWTVRELVDHVVHWQGYGGSILGAGTTPDDDWATIRPALSDALDDPANLEGTTEAMGGMPKHQVAGFAIGDLVIHTWDLARSIGANETLPSEAVDATMLGLSRLPPETLRRSDMFGEPVEIADDANAQDQLLAFVGRTP